MSDCDEAALIDALCGADPSERRAALERLASALRPLEEATALAVVECLGSPAKAEQRRAADVLCAGGAAQRPAVMARLRDMTRGSDPRRRWGATFALTRLGALDPGMLPVLVEALGGRDGDQRWAAAEMAVTCGRWHSEVVVEAMLDLVASGTPEGRKMALYVLRDLAPGTQVVVDAFVAGLADADTRVRLAALSGLCRLDPIPADACERILALLRSDPDAGLRRAAVSALGRVGRGVPAVAAVLADAEASDDPGLKRAAAVARRLLGA